MKFNQYNREEMLKILPFPRSSTHRLLHWEKLFFVSSSWRVDSAAYICEVLSDWQFIINGIVRVLACADGGTRRIGRKMCHCLGIDTTTHTYMRSQSYLLPHLCMLSLILLTWVCGLFRGTTKFCQGRSRPGDRCSDSGMSDVVGYVSFQRRTLTWLVSPSRGYLYTSLMKLLRTDVSL